jgi:CheY-like chemotaxis protein
MLSRVQSGLLLLVDADRRAQRGVTKVAAELGLEVVACDTARAGVNAACALEPVAIVTELELPDMDGLWFVAQIRDQPTDVAACPIVVVTHEIDTSSRARTLKAGADVFLQKPIAAADLVAQVKALVAMVQRVRDRRGPLSWVGAPPKSAPPASVPAPAAAAPPAPASGPDEVAVPRSRRGATRPPPEESAPPRSRRSPTRPPPEDAAPPRSRRGATKPPPAKVAAGPSAPPAKSSPSKAPKAVGPMRPLPVKVPPVRVPMFGPVASSAGPGAPPGSGASAPPRPLAAVPPAPARLAPLSPPRPTPGASPPRPDASPRAPALPRPPAPPRAAASPSTSKPEHDEPGDDDVIEAENDG